jgi:hypothetical protein
LATGEIKMAARMILMQNLLQENAQTGSITESLEGRPTLWMNFQIILRGIAYICLVHGPGKGHKKDTEPVS